MIRTIVFATLVALVATGAYAGTIQARSDQPASVFLDGDYVGRTPVDIPGVRGQHTLTFRSRAGGESLSYDVQARGRRHISRITANFGYAATPRAVVPRVYGAPYRARDWDRSDRWDRNDRWERSDRTDRWDDRYYRSW